jgi:hypothetical protein
LAGKISEGFSGAAFPVLYIRRQAGLATERFSLSSSPS